MRAKESKLGLLKPVSYTHLDVYKRQVLYTAALANISENILFIVSQRVSVNLLIKYKDRIILFEMFSDSLNIYIGLLCLKT